jgi:signal transduction histidine kinase
MKLGLFRRYYLQTAFIVLVFIVIGFLTSRLVINFSTPAPFDNRHSAFYAKLIDHLNTQDRVAALKEVLDWNSGGFPLHLGILDKNGSFLYTSLPSMPTGSVADWDSLRLPSAPYETVVISATPAESKSAIRFSGNPAQYLYVENDRNRERNGVWHFSTLYIRTLGSLVVSVLLGIALSMILLFRGLRNSAVLADNVIAELQSGNLKARFPVKRMDEIGRAMSRFNRMADEIERLVEQLKGVEKSRMFLLQELAHDLRTPVASLKNLLETLYSKGDAVALKLREELLSLALKETDYFEHLVEDLLILAQVTEPRYQTKSEQVAVNELLDYEVDSLAAQKSVRLHKDISPQKVLVSGDVHMLRRMIRNGLENAFSFAQNEVSVKLLSEKTGMVSILIEDDGKGFSEESLQAYGERRVSRMLIKDKTERLSVGLGSVILKTVASMHGGSVKVENRMSQGNVLGASLRITLPTVP